jgi:hypothetical protein
LEDLAATYSPASWDAVPWALGVFTAEFGMGSGAGPPPKPPGRPIHPDGSGCVLVRDCWGMLSTLRMISMHGVVLELYRAIRTGQLRALPPLHIRPIDVMVYHGPLGVAPWETWF